MHVAVVAGETSGDQLGGGVLASLRGLGGDLRITGVGGNAMAAQGLESLHAMEDISLMGLDGVTEKLFKAIRIRRSLFNTFLDDPPDVFLGIDIHDFNISLEQRLKAHRIATAHLVSPTVWAWRSYSMRKIRKAVDLMLVLFPFEETFGQQETINSMIDDLVSDQPMDRLVCGDAGFLMNVQDIETAVRHKLNIVTVILMDGEYGLIKWKQQNGFAGDIQFISLYQ